MEVTINGAVMVGIIILAVVIGYLIGRSEHRALAAEEEPTPEKVPVSENMSGSEEVRERRRPVEAAATVNRQTQTERRYRGEGKRAHQGKMIASPVTGTVDYYSESGRTGAVIEPEQGQIYAPMSGKIIKLFPMGNAFILRLEDQTELLIRVGRRQPDELCSMYYHSRIVQNEIVNKGKLLLAFDMERLKAAGEELSVIVSPEEGMTLGNVTVTPKGRVKVGEELLWIS